MMDPEDDSERDEEERPPERTACAACGSEEIVRRPRFMAFAIIALLALAFGIAFNQMEAVFYLIGAVAIFAMVSDRWVCAECGASWK